MSGDNNELSTPTSRHFKPGDTIADRFRLVDKLGSGGFATVFSAHQRGLEREVAIKILRSQSGSDFKPEFLARFEQEARIAAGLRHPNVVAIHDYGVDISTGQPYIVMERLRGETLGDILKGEGPLTLMRTLQLFIPCLDALGEGHKRGIIHKDLKPCNLFLVHPQDAIKEALIITDYGIARIQSEGEMGFTGTGEFLGTPQYLAPEYLQGHEVSPAVDVYQMGLILIEALSGRPAVDHQEPFPCMAAHLNGTLKIPSALQRGELGEIIQKATALNPEERFTDGYQMRDAMAELMSTPPSSRPPTSQSVLSHQRAQRVEPPQRVKIGTTPTAQDAPTFSVTGEGEARRERKRQVTPPTQKGSWLWFVCAAVILGVGVAGCMGVVILGTVMLPDVRGLGDTAATTPLETITINAARYRPGERQENTDISHSEVTWSPAIPAGELFSVQQTVEQELSREFKALKVRDGVVVKALIRYDKKVSTVTSDAEIINTPSQLEGKRYRVEREGDNLSVKTAAGEAVASAEAYEVQQDSAGFGDPDPLSELLANRTITMGETIELSRQKAAEVFRSQKKALKVNYFRMTLTKVQIRDGVKVAVFETETEFRRKNLNGQWDLLMTMKGEIHFGLKTGRMMKLLLSGPLKGTGVVDGVKVTGEGSSTYEVSARFEGRKK